MKSQALHTAVILYCMRLWEKFDVCSLPSSQKVNSPNLLKRKCISEVVRIGSGIIFNRGEL